MAAVTLGIATTDTANQSAYNSSAFTPAAGDLLVVFAAATGEAFATPTATELAANNGMTFTLIGSVAKPVAGDTIYAFVSNQLVPASPVSMSVRVDFTAADLATGCVTSVMRVSGMTLTGSSAVRQTATDSGALNSTPTLVFPAACLTGNPTVVGHFDTSATGTTPPTNWTELYDVTYASPTTGASGVSRNSGFTGTTITWGGTATQHADFAIELDASSGSTVTGTATPTEGANTSSASGVEVFTGPSATTNAPDVSSVTAVEVFTGTAARTEGSDTPSATGREVFTGTSATTNSPDSPSSAGLEVLTGSSATTNAPDTSSASGSVAGVTITGSAAVTESRDTASAAGTVTVNWFRTPTTRRKAGDRRLYDLYTLNKGISVVKVDGHYRRYPIPPHTILLPLVAGRDYFIGGTAAVVVTSDVAAALTADGFTVYDHNPDED